MTKPVLSLVIAAALATAAAAQDGGGPAAPPGPAANPPPAAQRKPVKEPSKALAGRIEDSLRGVFATSAAGRLSARAGLEAAVSDWEAEVKEDPLRAVKWWRGMLAETLPAGTRHAGIVAEKVPYLPGREATLWVSTPKTYGPKGVFPMVLVVLDKGEDPKKALPSMYGELLKDWIVVAVVSDPKETGFDVVKEPWLTAVGLRFAVDHLRVDRDRVVLDASWGSSNLALSLGAEWAVQFSGFVLRGASASTPLVSNLALGSVLALAPDAASDAQKKVVEDLKASVPAATMGAGGKGEADTVQKWIAATPPRRISRPEAATFSWKTRPQNGEPWGYWLWVFKAADPRRDKLVTVTVTRDAAGAVIDVVSDNLAEAILLLNDEVVDLDRDVAVKVNGREVWKGRAERRVKTALAWIGQTGERTLFVPAELRFTVPADLQQPQKKDDGNAPGDGAPPPPPPPPSPPKGGNGDGGGEGGDKGGGDEKGGGDKGGG